MPIVIVGFKGLQYVVLIPKDDILCDAYNDSVAVSEDEINRLPIGYAICDERC